MLLLEHIPAAARPRQEWGQADLLAMLEAAGTGILAVDLRGRCVFINPAASRMIGCPREDCIGRDTHEMLHSRRPDGSIYPKEECLLRRAFESGVGVPVGEDVFWRADGSCFPVDRSAQPIMVDGRVQGSVVTFSDISKRKEAEKAAQKSQDWLQSAQAAAGVGIWDWEAATGETRASDVQFGLFGLEPGKAFPLGEEFLQLIHPEDRERIRQELNLSKEGKKPYKSEFRVVWPDGSVHWLFGRGKVFFDDTGRPIRSIGANVDITDRVRAEAALEQFFNVSVAPLAICGYDGYIQRANPALLRDSKYTLEEIRGRSFLAFIHPDDRETALTNWMGALKSGKGTGLEYRILLKDGTQRWMDFSVAPVADEELVYVAAHDITDRKQAELALAEETVRRRILFEQSKDGIFVVDQSGAVYETNRSFDDMLGYSAEEMRRLHVWDWNAQWTRDEILEMMGDVKRHPATFETRHRRKDGTLIDVEVSCSVADMGKEVFFYAVVRDISSRKAAERAVHESEERFGLLAETISEVFWMADAEIANILYVLSLIHISEPTRPY